MNDYAFFYMFTAVGVLVLLIVWIGLPFAVFGTKPRLDEMLKELARINVSLSELNALLSSQRDAVPKRD